MSLTIELAPGLEKSLKAAAAEQGVEAEDLVRRWIEHHLGGENAPSTAESCVLTPEEWLEQADRWIAGHRDWPVLDKSANDRASYYE